MIDTSQLEADASEAVVEFRDALINYKRRSGRMFPTCSEVLEVLGELGYARKPLGGGEEADAAAPDAVAEPSAVNA